MCICLPQLRSSSARVRNLPSRYTRAFTQSTVQDPTVLRGAWSRLSPVCGRPSCCTSPYPFAFCASLSVIFMRHQRRIASSSTAGCYELGAFTYTCPMRCVCSCLPQLHGNFYSFIELIQLVALVRSLSLYSTALPSRAMYVIGWTRVATCHAAIHFCIAPNFLCPSLWPSCGLLMPTLQHTTTTRGCSLIRALMLAPILIFSLVHYQRPARCPHSLAQHLHQGIFDHKFFEGSCHRCHQVRALIYF